MSEYCDVCRCDVDNYGHAEWCPCGVPENTCKLLRYVRSSGTAGQGSEAMGGGEGMTEKEPFDTVLNVQCPHRRGIVQLSRMAVSKEMAEENARLRALVERGTNVMEMNLAYWKAFVEDCRKALKD